MTKLLILFFGVAIMNLRADSTNIYEEIVKRNAFNLTGEKPTKILPPITDILRGEVFLTGIHSINNVKRVSLVVREKGNDKFVSLLENQGANGIYIKSIGSTNVLASVFGTHKLLSFEKHALPTIVTKSATPKLLQRSDKKNDKKEAKKSEPRASVVKVPSRRPQIDPRIIEKGLEYISRSEDSEKRDYIMKRLESLQSGQSNLKSNIDQNERRRQYDEWRKRNK
jgi:hypothetical protein